MIAEHSLVVLDCEPPHEKLNRGDVGTVVHVYRGGRGFEVEFVDGGGQTVASMGLTSAATRVIQWRVQRAASLQSGAGPQRLAPDGSAVRLFVVPPRNDR
jgi:hypothetical protein